MASNDDIASIIKWVIYKFIYLLFVIDKIKIFYYLYKNDLIY